MVPSRPARCFSAEKNCEARERRLVNRNGIDVECRDLDPASNRLQLSLPHLLISIRMRRWAAQTANLHCVGKRLSRMMPDGVLKPDWPPL